MARNPFTRELDAEDATNVRAAIQAEVEAEMNRTDENAEGQPTFEDYANDLYYRLGTILGMEN